ncbi:GspMb/PilO family protein [Candidatus Omnitrophota bacterium]
MIKKIFSLFARFSKREKIILYAAVFIIMLVLLDRVVLSPILSRIRSLTDEIVAQENVIRKNLHIVSQKGRIKKEMDKYASFIVAAQSEDEEMGAFLQEIEDLANESSVYVIDIKAVGTETADVLKKYLLKLNCEAQMEQLTKFFYSIENAQTMLKIEQFDLRPKTAGLTVLRCALSISKAVLQ